MMSDSDLDRGKRKTARQLLADVDRLRAYFGLAVLVIAIFTMRSWWDPIFVFVGAYCLWCFCSPFEPADRYPETPAGYKR